MDESDPAWRIAKGAVDSLGNDDGALDRVLAELNPRARDIARAYALCLTRSPFANSEATRLILNTRLQVALVQEHVAAQKRMGLTINILTGVLVALTLALVGFGGIDIWQTLHSRR